MNELRPDLPPLPKRWKRLPVHRGYPVPVFVESVDGVPDFRVIDSRWMLRAVTGHLCWICGEDLGRYVSFVVGPMGGVNRISSEPPSHTECAEYAARVCPFLSRPHAHRREAGLPEGRVEGTGNPIEHNPGVTLVWTCRTYRVQRATAGNDGILFHMGEPTSLAFFAEGRSATEEEIDRAMEKGLAVLRPVAEGEGEDALHELERSLELWSRLRRNTALWRVHTPLL